ncbi:MAG: hypothetical protein AB7I41_04990 [Candidatus Sericytochromatia bacterium]
MGEINKISANPFDVKIQQMAADRRFHRETTITDEEGKQGSSPQQQQTGSSSSQPQAQENQGMTNMLETLRKRQEEENYTEYVDRRSNLMRERARQASEEYLRNVNELREEKAEEADKLVEEEQGFSKTYTSRLQDISQKHVEKVLKHKSENHLFEKSKDLLETGKKEADNKGLSLSSARAKLRPEVSKLISSRAEEPSAKPHSQGAEEPAQTNRNLLDNAVNKLRMKLGGAHTNAQKGIPGELNPILKPPGSEFQAKTDAHLFRPDLKQVQHSMAHAKDLGEDPNRYVPLEEADIQRLLYEHKLPMHQGTVQSLLLASQKLRDSSHHFLKAAVLVTTAGLSAERDLMKTVVEALRTYEKFPRQTIISKLLRFILGARVQQLKSQNQQTQPQNVPPPVEENDLILMQTHSVPNFKGGKGKLATGLPAQNAPLPSGPDRSKAPLYQAVERDQITILSPDEIAKAYEDAPDIHPLQEEMTALLKNYGLPASKVMALQLLQSAQGNPLRAQSMALQLALGQPLSPEALQAMDQKLSTLSPEERQMSLPELLENLEIPLPDKLAERLNTGGDSSVSLRLSPQQDRQWKALLSGSMAPLRLHLENAPLPAREAILLLQMLGERTETLSSLLPRLQQALRQNPAATLEQLAQLKPGLEQALAQLEVPENRTLKLDSRQNLIKAYAQSLQPGADPELLPKVLKGLDWTRPTTLAAETMSPEDWQLPELPSAKKSAAPMATPPMAPEFLEKLPESTQRLLEKMPLSRQALQLLERLGAQTGIEEALLSRLQSRLSGPLAHTILQRMEHLAPLLKQGLGQIKQPPGQILSPESQQQLLHVISQQLDKGGQAYLLPRVMADLHWKMPGESQLKSGSALPNSAPLPLNNPSLQRVLQPNPSAKTPPLSLPGPELSASAWADHLLGGLNLSPEQKSLTRESLLVLAQLSERTQTLQSLLPPIAKLLQAQPQLTANNLQAIYPSLSHALERYLAAGAQALPKANQEALVELVTQRLQLQSETQPAQSQNQQINQLWSRFYPGELPAPLQQILSGSEARQGFVDLHQLCQDFELGGYWQQSAQKLWAQPPAELGARLAQLPLLLQPALGHLSAYPQQQWMLSSPLQNRLTQALNQFLSQGQPEALQAALVRLMTENPHLRDPLPLVQERLRLWGLNAEPALAQHLWQMAAGSRDRLDALALLAKGNMPLIQSNIELVLSYIRALPPQSRFQSASQILAFLSPKLISLINQQMQSGQLPAPTAQAAEENEAELHFLARFLSQPLSGEGHQAKIRQSLQGQANPFAGIFALEPELAQLLPLLGKVQSGPVQVFTQWLQNLQALLRQWQDLLNNLRSAGTMSLADLAPLRQLAASLQAGFLNLEEGLDADLALLPRTGDPFARLPAQLRQILAELTQSQALPRDLSFLSRQIGHKLAGLAPELATFFHNLEGTEQAQELPKKIQGLGILPDLAEELPETALQTLNQIQDLPEDLPRLQNYLRALGIPLHDPGDLRQILALAEGSRDRLDAIGILLRNQMPLIPAHIQILAEYVRLLPPQERFKSISQILLFLSDALLAKMKEQLQQTGKQATLNQLLKPQGWQLDEEAEAKGMQLLQEFPGEVSEETFEGLRYLMQSHLPKNPVQLEKMQQLLHSDLNPRALLQPVQEPLAHLLGLLQASLPASLRYTQLAQAFLLLVQNHLQLCQQLLSPAQQAQLGPWLIGLSEQLLAEDTRFKSALDSAEAELVEEGGEVPQPGESWLARVLRQLKGMARQIAEKQPELREETQLILRRFMQQAQLLEDQLSSLQLFMQTDPGPSAQAEGAKGANQSTSPQLLIPAFIQSLGYPVEISIRPQTEEGGQGQGGTAGTLIQLNIRTHTLGTLVFSLNMRGKALRIRLGVEKRQIQEWLQPYLDALQQKLGEFPFEIQSIQSYVVPSAHAGHNLIARQMRTRYRRSSIDAL